MVKKIIKFYGVWCQPCKQLGPIFEEIKKDPKYEGIEFINIDVDEDEEDLCGKLMIKSVPTTVILDENDNELKRIIGFLPKSDYVKLIDGEVFKENSSEENNKEKENK